MASPEDRLTEPLRAPRTPTRPLEALSGPEAPPWRCARCEGLVEPLSQGHYRTTCASSGAEERFHFCCPRQCELDQRPEY